MMITLHLSSVDWEHPQWRAMGHGPRARRQRVYPVTCPNCGQVRWLKAYDAKRAEREQCECFRCAQSRKGRRGWLATVTKYGQKTAVKHQQQYRLANPSTLERQLMGMLDAHQIAYEREVWFEHEGHVYLIDFVLARRLAVEVNGTYIHNQHAERDRRKAEAIQQRYPLIVISDADFTADLPIRIQQKLKD